MKSIHVLAIMLFISTVVVGQELPKKEFQPSLSTNVLSINPGESKELKVSIVRSKAWAKSTANVSIPAPLPEGISISFEPEQGLFNESILTVTIAPDVKSGVYTLLVRSEMRQTKKGNLLRLEVGNQSVAAEN